MADTNAKRTPKALWEVSKLMLKLTQNVFASMRIDHSYKVKIAKLEKEKKEKLAEQKARHDTLVGEIFSLMKFRRAEVESSGTKSVTLATGQVGWRDAAPRVEILEGYTEKSIVDRLLKRGKKYLRIKAELNREKILADFHAGTLQNHRGIKVRQGMEELFISLSPRGKDKPKIITIDSE
jgi:phage host-nuclease inhibitor protein Gam